MAVLLEGEARRDGLWHATLRVAPPLQKNLAVAALPAKAFF